MIISVYLLHFESYDAIVKGVSLNYGYKTHLNLILWHSHTSSYKEIY